MYGRRSKESKGTSRALTMQDLLTPSPKLQEAARSKRLPLLLRKLKLCSILLEWGGPDSKEMTRAKEIKGRLLLEVVEFLGPNKDIYSDKQTVPSIIAMVSANLFRALPPPVDEDELDEDDPQFDPRWPHLQIVYEILLRVSVSSEVDAGTLKRSITGSFVVQLLELFDSEDHRERDYLKTILHRVYAKCMPLRQFIRRSIHNVFFTYIYDTGKHNGIAELLEILGSIINGLALPIKVEHKKFLKQLLTPLHKMPEIAQFHPQLAYCVSQFVDKDPTLAVPVIGGLLRFWPKVDSQKELLFLNELEELLELTQPEQFNQLSIPLFQRVAQCVGAPHFQVAERALYIWQNDHIAELIARNCDSILAVMFPVLHKSSQNHWNATVHTLSMDVMQQFQDMRPRKVEQLTKAFVASDAQRKATCRRRVAQWDSLRSANVR